MKGFKFYKQLNEMDCGATCLRMISQYHKKYYTAQTIRNIVGFNKLGASLLGISDAAAKLGFGSTPVKIAIGEMRNLLLPCILHWDQNHFVVLLKVYKTRIKVADPAKGICEYTLIEVQERWGKITDTDIPPMGIALILEPKPEFYLKKDEVKENIKWGSLLKYFQGSGTRMLYVILCIAIISIIQFVFPFLTQNIVDVGIHSHNIRFIFIVLISQLMLIFSQTIFDFIRNRLLLKVSNIFNFHIVSDFWIKLMSLPLSYFSVHQAGDTIQRINDHRKIQNFLTGNAISTLFSFFNLIIYAIALAIYDKQILFVFCICSVIYLAWVSLFFKYRRQVNFEIFSLSSKENTATFQLIQGMQEIRLNGAERIRRWEWENIQANLFKINFKSLNYSQIQNLGAICINQIQSIIITFFVAQLVIDGQLSIGAMLAIQFIVGQMSLPIQQLVTFMQNYQDAKIGMERLNEIHNLQDEFDPKVNNIVALPVEKTIHLLNLNFTYPGAEVSILNEINLSICTNQVTAIVGASGSGKTTLLKILLKIFDDYSGKIMIGSINDDKGSDFRSFDPNYWRSRCGSVLQDGFIFNDSVAKNIAISDDEPDIALVIESCKIANIDSFINSLPNGYNTKLGNQGIGVSQGQRQRILIARAIYKNPEFIFLDEATNALDSKNETEITKKLDHFYKGKTVVVVAHRLSTVKNADKIIVLEHGRVVEQGKHDELLSLRGKYFSLVESQMELMIQ